MFLANSVVINVKDQLYRLSGDGQVRGGVKLATLSFYRPPAFGGDAGKCPFAAVDKDNIIKLINFLSDEIYRDDTNVEFKVITTGTKVEQQKLEDAK